MSSFIKNTKYYTLESLEESVREYAASSGVPAEVVTLGHSTEERPISGVCFGDSGRRGPEMLYFAGVHAMELIGCAAALDIIRRLSEGEATEGIKSALERVNVWIIPALNPDGYASVEKMLSTGLGLALARKNARGVDLNRNFPVGFYHIPRSIFAGSPLKASPHFRGAMPCSEAESQTLRDFIFGRNIRMSLNFHSFGELILFPYHHTKKKCGDHDTLMRLGEEIASRQERPYSVKPSWKLYPANGEIDDWLYDECNILPFCMEIGKLGVNPGRPETWLNPFYWANPVEPQEELNNVAPAAMYLIEAASEMFGILGT